MRTVVRLLLPLAVLVLAALGARAILSSAPEAERRETRETRRAVEAITLRPTDYPVVIRSSGTVRPTRERSLVPEVVGTVTEVHEAFVVGGRFEAGDVLVQLDERDYRIALTRAAANLAQAEAQLAEQEALAETARADWDALGRRGEPSTLTLREPQRAAAEASRDAAAAELERARLDLDRTRLVAPFDGRVLAAEATVGQFVNRGTPIGRIHAIDSVEVALPVSARQLEYLDIDGGQAGARVEVATEVGNVQRVWTGELIRTEGVDAATQQLNVVARIAEPYASDEAPLRIGRFVGARVQGEVLSQVFVVPRGSVRDRREVLLLDEDSRIERRPVEIVWSDDERHVIGAGLESGERLVITPLATVADGAPVRATIDGEAPPLEALGSDARTRGEPPVRADDTASSLDAEFETETDDGGDDESDTGGDDGSGSAIDPSAGNGPSES